MVKAFGVGLFFWLLAVNYATAGAPTPLPSNAQPQIKEVQVAPQSFSRGAPVPAWVESVPMPERDTSRPLVERLADTQFHVDEQPTAFIHFAMTINDASVLSSMSQLPIEFVPEYQQLKLHSVRILRGAEALDRTQTALIRFLQSDATLSANSYRDVVTASVLIDDVRVGDTIECSYSILGQNPVFGTKFFNDAAWDQQYPVTQRRISIIYPADRKIKWRSIGDAPIGVAIQPSESESGGQKKLVFEAVGIPEKNAEPSTPADYTTFRWIQFSDYNDWNEVASWASRLFEVPDHPRGELAQQIERLKAAASDEQRVVKALEFVQSEIGYFSVSLGENTHRPEPPERVLQHRYGDCKDKALLMVALLKPLGIDVRPVLLSVARRKGLERGLPSPFSFDHAIVKVHLDDRDYYIDPTRMDQHGRLDRMGQPYEGYQVLVIAPDTQNLVTISNPNALDLRRSDTTATVRVADFSGDVDLQTVDTLNGVEAETIRTVLRRLSRDQFQQSLAESMSRFFPGALLEGAVTAEDDTFNNVITLSSAYKVPKFLKENKEAWYFVFSPTNLWGAITAPASPSRKSPLKMALFPFEGKFTLMTELPSNVHILRDRLEHSTKNGFFIYQASSEYRGNKVTTDVSLKPLVDVIDVADLGKYSLDISATRNPAGSLVIIPKKYISQSKSVAKLDFEQNLRHQRTEEIANYSRWIASNKLKPRQLASKYCERSAQYSNLNMMREAFRDLDKAIRLDPNNPNIWLCRGEVKFDAAAFSQSIADFTKAISLDGKDPYFYRKRGQSEFYRGDLLAAVEDFKKASAGRDLHTRNYSDIWLAISLMRLNQPLPGDLVRRAGADPRGVWPLPLLAVMAGYLTPEDVMKIVDRKSGDEIRSAGTEAHYYLGHYYLHRGNKEKAREEFQKTRDLNLFTYTEFKAAEFELHALNSRDLTTSALRVNSAEPKSVRSANAPVKSSDGQHRTVPKPISSEYEWNRNPLQQ